MPPRPHVTVLMAVRDGAPHLRTQLDSIAGQDGVDWSIWVSDDGSRDDSVAIVRTFAKDHPGRDVRLLDGPRAGAARNFLSLLCRDDLPAGLIALSDQDDKWLPGKLARAAHRIAPPDATPRLYGARWVIADSGLAPIAPSPKVGRPPSLENALVQNIVSGHTTVLNAAFRETIRTVGPVTVPFHDWWLYQLATGTGAEVLIDPEPVLLYRQHGANVAGTRRGLRPSLRRFQGLFDGTMAGWLRQNVAALRQANGLLTEEARSVLDAIPQSGPIRAVHLRRMGFHRQTRVGTAALHLAAALGRL